MHTQNICNIDHRPAFCLASWWGKLQDESALKMLSWNYKFRYLPTIFISRSGYHVISASVNKIYWLIDWWSRLINRTHLLIMHCTVCLSIRIKSKQTKTGTCLPLQRYTALILILTEGVGIGIQFTIILFRIYHFQNIFGSWCLDSN